MGGVWGDIVYLSSVMFRGKESSNRIKLSRLVQDLLNFGVSGSLQLWGWGWLGDAPHTCVHTHACTHTHARTHMQAHIHIKHDNFKWQPPLGESLGIPYDVTCARMCMHMRVCACV